MSIKNTAIAGINSDIMNMTVEVKQQYLQVNDVSFQQSSAPLSGLPPIISLNRLQTKCYIIQIYNKIKMNNYDKILREFQRLGYNENGYLQQNQINKAMDTISSQNAGFSEFDRSIAEELWGHCQVDQSRRVRLKDYINTIIQAQIILREQVGITEEALRMENRPKQRSQLQDQYNQILSDHRIITTPFGLSPLRQVNSVQNSYLLQNKGSSYRPAGDSVIFGYQPNVRQQSANDLRICLFIAVFAFLWQLILMFVKHHFLSLLCIFAILSIFFLNYFDKYYMKFLLILIAVTIIFDIVWLGMNARQYWSPDPQTQHSTLHNGFLAFVFIMIIILMVLKIAMLGILIKYRNNGESLKKNVSILGYRMKLDGRPSHNPLTPLLRTAPYIGNN